MTLQPLYKRRGGKKPRRGSDVTVCIAAICVGPTNDLMIVGASDRMLTAGDIQFEPPQKKIYRFFDWAYALTAGDAYAQMSICSRAASAFAQRMPQTVEDVALGYAEAFTRFRRERAEAKFLKPLGLDANSFIDRQQDMRADQVANLNLHLQAAEIEVETIIVGFDRFGPHIFLVGDPGDVYCADSTAFAAIGSGKRHAESQFMLSHYTRLVPVHKAMLLTYTAKKRAEVSPGIGKETDLFYIAAGGLDMLSDEIHAKLKDIHENMEAKHAEAVKEADAEAKNFLDQLVKKRKEEEERKNAQPPAPLVVPDTSAAASGGPK